MTTFSLWILHNQADHWVFFSRTCFDHWRHILDLSVLGRQFHILRKRRGWIALRGGRMASNVSLKCYFLPVTLDTSEKSFITNTFTAVTNALLSFITVCGNAFAIFTISKQPHTRQLPYNILLCCLAFADFTVGISAQPTLAIYKVMELSKAPFRSYCAARIVQSYFGWLTAGVSLHILCAISVDRYLALRLHMRYAAVVTFTRVLKLIVGLWLFTVFLGSVRFFVAAPIWLAAVWLILLANIVLILVSYCKVFQIIRRHRRQIQARDQLAEYFHGRSAVEVARHRRSAVTMMYVLGIFISCYLPLFATIFVERIQGYSTGVRIAYDLSTTVVFLSSTLNPFLYCWRIRGIRRKVLETFRRIGLPTTVWKLKFQQGHTQRNNVGLNAAGINVSRGLRHLYEQGWYKKLVRALRKPRTSSSIQMSRRSVLLLAVTLSIPLKFWGEQ